MDQLPSIRRWAEQRIGCRFEVCQTIAWYEHDELKTVMVFSDFKVRSAEFSIATEGNIPRVMIRFACDLIFNLHGKTRVTAFVSPFNEKTLNIVERAGFVYEGTQRQAADGGADLRMYGMLKHECRWL